MIDFGTRDEPKTVSPEFLSDDEMALLTGYKHTAKQRKWLDEAGVPYFTPHGGARVIVLREWLRNSREHTVMSVQPNFSALG